MLVILILNVFKRVSIYEDSVHKLVDSRHDCFFPLIYENDKIFQLLASY